MISPEEEIQNIMAEQRIADAAAESGRAFQGYGLSIGDHEGSMVPAMRALGIGRVGLIDPDVASVEAAIASGVIPRENTYVQTFQEYAAAGHEPADAAFVFNMPPPLVDSTNFIRTLGSVVRQYGLIVTSFTEPIAAIRFGSTGTYLGQMQRIATAEPGESVHGPHAYIQLWQRV